jgi:hypothetical protein
VIKDFFWIDMAALLRFLDLGTLSCSALCKANHVPNSTPPFAAAFSHMTQAFAAGQVGSELAGRPPGVAKRLKINP